MYIHGLWPLGSYRAGEGRGEESKGGQGKLHNLELLSVTLEFLLCSTHGISVDRGG